MINTIRYVLDFLTIINNMQTVNGKQNKHELNIQRLRPTPCYCRAHDWEKLKVNEAKLSRAEHKTGNLTGTESVTKYISAEVISDVSTRPNSVRLKTVANVLKYYIRIIGKRFESENVL